jgi:hypothetical protein
VAQIDFSRRSIAVRLWPAGYWKAVSLVHLRVDTKDKQMPSGAGKVEAAK